MKLLHFHDNFEMIRNLITNSYVHVYAAMPVDNIDNDVFDDVIMSRNRLKFWNVVTLVLGPGVIKSRKKYQVCGHYFCINYDLGCSELHLCRVCTAGIRSYGRISNGVRRLLRKCSFGVGGHTFLL